MQGECSSNQMKRCFIMIDIAEPSLIFCNDNANEWKERLLFVSRVQLIFCKDNANSMPHKIKSAIFTTIRHIVAGTVKAHDKVFSCQSGALCVCESVTYAYILVYKEA